MSNLGEQAMAILDELHTERLAYESEYVPLADAANLLTAYEETGMAPEDITKLSAQLDYWKAQAFRGCMDKGPLEERIKVLETENSTLRKMQPVQLDDVSAQTMELAAVVSELRLKVSDLQRETERQRKTAENWRECWDRELGLRKAAEARAEKAEKVLSATYRTIYALASDCTPEVCKELCANHDGVCSKHAEAGHYDRCKGFKWIGEKEEQNSNDTNADTAAPDPVC